MERPKGTVNGDEELPPNPVIIRAKIFPPRPRPGVVRRGRLCDALDAFVASAERIALVVAPAGYGKTTLVSAWLEERERNAAWVTFDPSDDEPTVFWTYVLEALCERNPEVGPRSLRALRSGGRFDWKHLVPLALSELETVQEDLMLVLDDLQVITSADCLEGLGHFLERLPAHVRVILLSRTDPALPLARFQARGHMTELRMADLRFTPEEAAEMLNVREGLDLTEEDVALLHARTEGWPAAIYLAARAFRAASPASRSLFSLISKPDARLFDYVNSEVLGDLGTDTRRFLAQTSVVGSVTPALANALTGRTDSAAVLEELSQTNRLVAALDGRFDWYRYHPLLRDSLAAELRRRGEDIEALHLRAAEWFESEGLMFPAVDHALQARLPNSAADLIGRHRVELTRSGLAAPIQRWLDQLPDDVAAATPGLALLATGCLYALDVDSPAFARWERLAREGADAQGTFEGIHGDRAPLSLIPSIRIAVIGKHAEACVEAARTLMRDAEPGSIWFRFGGAQLAVALYLREGATTEVLAAANDSLDGANPNPYPIADIQGVSVLALHALDNGETGTARSLADEALQKVASANRETSPQSAMAHIALGRWLALEGRFDEAEATIRHALSLRQADPARIWYVHGLLALADVLSVAGDRPGAGSALADAKRLLPRLQDPGILPSMLDSLETRNQALDVPVTLSRAELRVLRVLAGSLSLRDVGHELYLSRDTVKTHTRSLYRKLGVHSREEAVAAARARGWLR
jgi:LuxR family maltose regulon positive regulatory protein